MKLVTEISDALQMLSVSDKVEIYSRFFKTGKGEYGEGDLFIGVTVPDQRSVAKAYFGKVSFDDIEKLLQSKIHEHRSTALYMLVYKYEKEKQELGKQEIVNFYLNNRSFINNWDLVDCSCYKILGQYCLDRKNDSILLTLSDDENMWSKRMAVVGSMSYIKKGYYQLTFDLVLRNLKHPHDLMHKANGWLLREVGKKDEDILIQFLSHHYQNMPRTTLRYAIEKLNEPLRQEFLKGKI